MSVIAALLLGEGPDVAFGAAKATYKRFLKQDSLGRLLVVLAHDFGDETNLQTDVFLSWKTREDFAGYAVELFAGRRSAAEPNDVAELQAIIEARLVRTPPAEVADLAHRIAEASLRVAPLVVEGGGEATQLVTGRLDGTERRILRAIESLADETDEPPDLARALLVGPLRHIGGVEELEAAERQADEGDQVVAAERIIDVARQLDAQRLRAAAETLRERAAVLLAAAGESTRSLELLIDIADARAARGSRWAVQAVARTARATGAPPWIPDAMEALVLWTEQPRALDQLKEATDRSAGSSDNLRWLAAYVDLLYLHGRFQELLDITSGLSSPNPGGNSLAILLDRLEAMESLGRGESADTEWLALLRTLDEQQADLDAALAYQRRATMLAYREDLSGAEDAYRRAIAHWAAVPGYEEQAADAFFSMQAAYVFNARIEVPDQELRPLAIALRGDSDAPVAQADRLVADGMAARLEGRLPDAKEAYWLAYAIQRRTGSLAGLHASGKVLAELHEHAGELGAAMSLYIDVGNGKKAAEMAGGLAPAEVAERLTPRRARWERAAAYHVIAEVGRTLPQHFIAASVEQILAEAKVVPDSILSPQPAAAARRALAAVALAVPSELTESVLGQLRAQLWQSTIDVIKSTSLALILATNVGMTDDTTDVIRLFLQDPYNFGVDVGWVAQRAQADQALADQLTAEALAGHGGALDALARARLIPANPALIALCSAATSNAAGIETVTETRDGNMVETSYAMGLHLEPVGILARDADAEIRKKFVDRMLALLNDRREPEQNRASAAGAIFNLAVALDASEALKIAEVLQPIALGRYELSPMDQNDNHPLSRWQISLHIPHHLRVAALSALARVAATHDELDIGPLQEAVVRATAEGPDSVIAAALEAAAQRPDLQLPFAPESALRSPSVEVRRAAFDAWRARNDQLPTPEMATAIRSDPDTNLRVELLEIAAEVGESGQDVLRSLADDPDSYVRALATRRLDGD